MTYLVLDHVSKVYRGGIRAVDDLTLDARDGELLVLVGPSGCGKTTILRLIAGLEVITSGTILLNGTVVNDLTPTERNVSMVFQDGALYPHLTVQGNLEFPLRIADAPDTDARSKARELAHALGIGDTLDRKPGTLSGGQRQRVAIGRALMRDPSVFLMDEPLASLDAGLRSELRTEVAALIRSLGVTTIYVTHDQVEALTLADRVAVLRNGLLEDLGTPERVYDDPATAFTAAFLSSSPTSMAAATVKVVPGQRVILDLGEQQLSVPWSDPMAGHLSYHVGDQVIAGLRPNALAPAHADDGDFLLRGEIREVEYHGHEWLAHIDARLRAVDVDALPARENSFEQEPAEPEGRSQGAGAAWRRRVIDPMLDRATRSRGSRRSGHGHDGGRRRSTLMVRLDNPRGWHLGREAKVAVDLHKILLFDSAGQRIGIAGDDSGNAGVSSS